MAFRVSRGSGMAGQREGLLFQNVLATYTHLHALGCPQWARALVRRAREYHGDTDLEENASASGVRNAGTGAPVARDNAFRPSISTRRYQRFGWFFLARYFLGTPRNMNVAGGGRPGALVSSGCRCTGDSIDCVIQFVS